MRLILILLNFLILNSSFSQNNNLADNSNTNVFEYTYKIKGRFYKNDGTFLVSESTGFKVQGSTGILTALHSVINCTHLEIFDDAGNQFEAYIDSVDNRYDVALLKPFKKKNIYSDSIVVFGRNEGFKNGSLKLGTDKLKTGFQAFLCALWVSAADKPQVSKIDVSHDNSSEIPKFTVINSIINMGGDKTNLNTIYSDIDYLILATDKLKKGQSGAPVFFYYDNSPYVFGIVHGSSEKNDVSYLIPYDLIEFEKYNENRLGNYSKWNSDNAEVYKRLNSNKEKSPISIIQKMSYTRDSSITKKTINHRKLIFNFDEKFISILESDTLTSLSDWRLLTNKVRTKNLKKSMNYDAELLLLDIIDSLIFTENGLINELKFKDEKSLIHKLSAKLENMIIDDDQEFKKQNREFYTGYLSDISTEIFDIRLCFKNAQDYLNHANKYGRTKSEVQQDLYKAKYLCLEKSEQIRHSCVSGFIPNSVKKTIICFDSLAGVVQIEINTLEQAIDYEVFEAKEFIDSLYSKNDFKNAELVIEEIKINDAYQHIEFYLRKKLADWKKNSLDNFSFNSTVKNRSIANINEEIMIIYQKLYGRFYYNNIENFPLFMMQSDIVESDIRLKFSHETEMLNIRENNAYIVSSLIDYPMGSAKNSNSVQGATLTAEFLAAFINETREFLLRKYQISDFNTDIHIIGMSDGHRYKGAYKPENDYAKKDIKKFKYQNDLKCTVIREIGCFEHGTDQINNKKNITLNYKELDRLNGNSYKNNVKLAYHRALTYWGVMNKNIANSNLEEANITPHIYACNVPEKDGICRRTEIGITFSNFSLKQLNDVAEINSKPTIILDFERAIRRY